MGKYTATRVLTWDAAHRVMRHESKCATLHGHRYVAEITIGAAGLDGVGRVIDFGVVKDLLGSWIDEKLDHTTLVNSEDLDLLSFCMREHLQQGKRPPFVMHCEPTAENICQALLEKAVELFPPEVWVAKVKVWETANCFAEIVPG
jgi:6-pyruvoyltetrahydropterin/6-carboxytetrahydropterin synthase